MLGPISVDFRTATLNTPWVYLPSNAETNDLYLVILIDEALPLLHWMQPNMIAGTTRNLSFDAVAQGASAGSLLKSFRDIIADPSSDWSVLYTSSTTSW